MGYNREQFTSQYKSFGPCIDSVAIKDLSTPVQVRVVNNVLIVINTQLDTNPTSVIISLENMSRMSLFIHDCFINSRDCLNRKFKPSSEFL